MNERVLRKRLKRLTAAFALLSVLILAFGSLASYYLRTVLREALNEQMQSETEQYKINMLRQMDADYQTLDTLASFLRYSNMKTEAFINGFLDSKEHNDYEQLCFFGKGDVDINIKISSALDVDEDADLESMNKDVIQIVEQAWKGKSGISRIYSEADSDKKLFAYAVPVYAGDRLVGALTASLSTEVFEDVLEHNSILGGEGYIHMIADSGALLVRSENRVVKEEINSIYEGNYIAPEEAEKIAAAMSEGRGCASEFRYGSDSYQVLLEPIGVNGWYLFCVQTAQGVSSTIYDLMTNTRVITVAMLFVILIVLAFGYRMIYQGSRRLIKSSCYDPLTGAYNMVKFISEVDPVIKKTYEYSLAALNVRQFKFINEIFGSREADNLLCHIRKVISQNVRADEYYCRNSEDLFYILLNETDRKSIRSRIEKIIREIDDFDFGGHRDYQILMYCGVVIGTDVRDEEPDMQNALAHVRFALDTARTSLKNNIWFYDTHLHETEILENYVESHMNQALENQEFKMFLQPKIDLNTGKVGGAEALVRWIPDSGDMICPGQFIPIFENNGFCSNLDMYMVERVCRQIRDWIDAGVRPVPLSVNQSKLLFYEADYIDRMKTILAKYRIPENMITLEILEGLALENTNELNEKIVRLKELGFRISMDDFGSGYSSLNTLASLKIDELKFDREFLLRLEDEKMDYDRQVVIMKEIVNLTKKLRITTVVEGVESRENEELIRSFGCEYGQGFYYSRPVSAKEFSEKYMTCRSI